MRGVSVEVHEVGIIRGSKAILEGVSFRVRAGGCCGIIGPNGSGKSTLLAVLAGYIWPSRGSVQIGADRYGTVDLRRVRRMIGVVEPSRTPRFNERQSVREIVATGFFGSISLPLRVEIEAEQWARVDAELEAVGMGKQKEAVYGELSTGEQMKVLIARSMVGRRRLLLLDEPTVGLDIGARAGCVGVLEELSQRADAPTVIIVSHHLDELPRSVEQIVMLKEGRVYKQGPAEEMLTSENLSGLYDCRIEVIRRNGWYVASAERSRWAIGQA